jgi:WD40 repeat protein
MSNTVTPRLKTLVVALTVWACAPRIAPSPSPSPAPTPARQTEAPPPSAPRDAAAPARRTCSTADLPASWSPDGKFVVRSHNDELIVTGAPRFDRGEVLLGASGSAAHGFDRHGQLLIEEEGAVSIWSLANGKLVGRVQGRVANDDWSSLKGKLFTTSEPDPAATSCPPVRIWDLDPLRQARELPGRSDAGACLELSSVITSPTGDHAALSWSNGTIDLVDTRSTQPPLELEAREVSRTRGFAPDGSAFVWLAPNDRVGIWERKSGRHRTVSANA